MKRRNVRTLSLIVVTFTYLLIGAAVFDALEGPHNENAFEALSKIKSDIMTRYNMTEEDYKLMELLIIERKPHKNGPIEVHFGNWEVHKCLSGESNGKR